MRHPIIAQDFAQQSQHDFDNFINCCIVEMARGGTVFLLLGSHQDQTKPKNQCDLDFVFCLDYKNAWNDLIVDVCHNEHNILSLMNQFCDVQT